MERRNKIVKSFRNFAEFRVELAAGAEFEGGKSTLAGRFVAVKMEEYAEVRACSGEDSAKLDFVWWKTQLGILTQLQVLERAEQ